ncbi:MAG: RIP metalloprotease RseP [Cytophagales bacterium]|nr:RIP metalloprotease RseP [Cytophagales bacterium]
METIIMVAQLLLGLSILVGVHEWGHLIAAKTFGMRVEKFYIGFPPKVFGRKWGETEYCIGAIPLGGFVKISGMIDESLDTKNLSEEPEEWEFRAKPAWQRLIVMLGGIIVNIILGIIVFVTLTFLNGDQFIAKDQLNEHGIVAYDLGKELGFQTGDRIIDIKGNDFGRFSDILSANVLVSSEVYITVNRNGEKIKIDIPNNFIEKLSDKSTRGNVIGFRSPYYVNILGEGAKKIGLKKGDRIAEVNGISVTYFDELGPVLAKLKDSDVTLNVIRDGNPMKFSTHIDSTGTIGFNPGLDVFDNRITENYGFGESIAKGTTSAFNSLYINAKGIGKMFSGDVSPTKSLSGPIRIATMFGTDWDWTRFWTLVGLLSMVLAFMNLLPIPALDGGHVVFLSWEIITGRKPGEKFLENAQKVGMILLLGLMAFVIFNDIFQLSFG